MTRRDKIFAVMILSAVGTLILGSRLALAGFGITPPYVKNDSLTRNSVYEQRILMVRSDPSEDLKAEIAIDVPEVNAWFEVDKGREFILPKGEQKVPMVVKVTVPKDAKFKNYTGYIIIRTTPADESKIQRGVVNIALGAQIDVNINVVDRQILDFRIRKIELKDSQEGHKKWILYFPGKIRFSMMTENTGNSPVAPSKILFNIYDTKGEKLLEQTKNSNSISKIEPFQTKEVVAFLPTKLTAGNYIARYKIFNGDKVKQEGELPLSIVKYGSLPDVDGYGFDGLSLRDKGIVVSPILLIIAIFLLFVFRASKKKRRRKQ